MHALCTLRALSVHTARTHCASRAHPLCRCRNALCTLHAPIPQGDGASFHPGFDDPDVAGVMQSLLLDCRYDPYHGHNISEGEKPEVDEEDDGSHLCQVCGKVGHRVFGGLWTTEVAADVLGWRCCVARID